ncbi:uncharacterized protein LOC114515835 [Dendronephthya gigantea]|uniref:uncharacterized protein LOC114515835 n=1 Tax=Dendronephthya gigantea TaxID=151771 RepID=UPI00106B0CFC|nr:uncharacterized protein LOC114515835 [Dendronephthya gigantea]
MAGNTKREVDKAIAGMNKGSDKKEEIRMMMAPYANWDSFLSPAPLSIALLGQLILVSSDADFSLQNEKGNLKFKYLKYPDSFRACLVQVSNRGWDAFNRAHTSMDQIRHFSNNVDKHVKTAVKFLVAGTAEDIELMVPDALKNIERIADDCLELSTSVEKEFVDVMKLIAELLEACTKKKGQQEKSLRDAKIARSVAEQHMKAIDAEKEQAEKRQKQLEKQMKEADEKFKKAINSMPDEWDMIGLAFVVTLMSTTRACTSIPSMMMMERLLRQAPDASEAVGPSPVERPKNPENVMEIHKIVPDIYCEVEILGNLALNGMKSGDAAKITVGRAKKKLERIKENYLDNGKNSEIKRKAMKLCKGAIDLCQALSSIKPRMAGSEEEFQKINEKAKILREEADPLLAGSHFFLGSNALQNTSPNLAKQPAPDSEGGQEAMGSYRFKTETAKEMLKDSRRAYDKSCEEVAQKAREVSNLLAEIEELDLKEIDIEKIRKTLIKGITALGELREQWGKLVGFFQMLANIVKCCLNTSLKNFVQTSRNRLTQGNSGMSAAMRDVIFEQAFQANQIAYVVHSISSVYVEVSHKHLMERITCLGKLIPLDPTRDEHEIDIKREELNRGCKEAQEAIRNIALEKKREMDKAFDDRIGRIESEVETLLPPISEAKVMEIRGKVQSMIADLKADIDDEVNDLS